MKARFMRTFFGGTVIFAVGIPGLLAQGQGQQTPPSTAKASAPIDLTGYWVSVVTEDWRWRMVIPAKGDYASVPINRAAKEAADKWDPAKDAAAGEQCRSYGAPAIMRVPGRIHITWRDDNTLELESDAGQQTRLLHFGDWKPSKDERATWQGDSMATWETSAGAGGPGGRGGGAMPAEAPKSDDLKVVTTHLRPGYLRKNGVPYSAQTTLTEYWNVTKEQLLAGSHQNERWLVITTQVHDPVYLQEDWITGLHFKEEPDGSKWDPQACDPLAGEAMQHHKLTSELTAASPLDMVFGQQIVTVLREITAVRTVASAFIAGLLILASGGSAEAQQNAASEGLGVYQVRPNFFMIANAGANIGVQIGEDGAVLVDAGSASMSSKVLETIKKLTPRPVRYIIDTNAEPDHVGGNAALSNAGENLNVLSGAGNLTVGTAAPILSTGEVLNRMSAPTGRQAAFPSDAWPTEAFFTPERTMYFNDDGIELIHQPRAHSDGDLFVLFRRADVVMAGDILDTNHFPVIDVEKGGSVQGEIAALNRLIKLAIAPTPLVWKGGGTRVIPGHGFICDQADIVEYRDMVVIIRDIIQDLIKQGKTLEQIKEANPTEAYRPRYGADSGPWTTDQFVESIYKSLIGRTR